MSAAATRPRPRPGAFDRDPPASTGSMMAPISNKRSRLSRSPRSSDSATMSRWARTTRVRMRRDVAGPAALGFGVYQVAIALFIAIAPRAFYDSLGPYGVYN